MRLDHPHARVFVVFGLVGQRSVNSAVVSIGASGVLDAEAFEVRLRHRPIVDGRCFGAR